MRVRRATPCRTSAFAQKREKEEQIAGLWVWSQSKQEEKKEEEFGGRAVACAGGRCCSLPKLPRCTQPRAAGRPVGACLPQEEKEREKSGVSSLVIILCLPLLTAGPGRAWGLELVHLGSHHLVVGLGQVGLVKGGVVKRAGVVLRVAVAGAEDVAAAASTGGGRGSCSQARGWGQQGHASERGG